MATIHAYLAYTTLKPTDLIGLDQQKLAEVLSFTTNGEMENSDWIHVGTAEIHVRLDSGEDIINGAIKGLRRKQADLYAQSTAIEREIHKLLAITNEVAAA